MSSHLRFNSNVEKSNKEHAIKPSEDDRNRQLGITDIFKHSECRKATLVMFVIWNSTNLSRYCKYSILYHMGSKIHHLLILYDGIMFKRIINVLCLKLLSAYFGIAMSATNLSSNVYLAFILSAIVETPSLINIWFMSHWGRKPTLVLSLFVAGIGCLVGGLTSGTLRMVFVLIGIR